MNLRANTIPYTPLLPMIEENRLAQLKLSDFILQSGIEDFRGDRSFEKIERDLQCLIPFFEACIAKKFRLHPPSKIDLAKIHSDIQALTGARAITGTCCAPLNDCGSRPIWVAAEAMRKDFFKLLFQSVNTAFLRNVLASRRPGKWVNTAALEKRLWYHLGQDICGCIEMTLKPLMPKPYYWKHYAHKLLGNSPFPILRECLVAYALADEKMFRLYKALVEDSQNAFILGPQISVPGIWLILCGAEE